MAKFKKYEFIDQDEADLYINNLGVDEEGNPTHNNSIVYLGNIIITPGVYDEDGNETTPPVLSDKWSVDVLWDDGKDKDWKDKRIKLNGSNNSHTFYGWDYSDDTV